MQTTLTSALQGTRAAAQAASIVGKCVHCGFCNATCPTYQLLGDELDGPRGRIYLIRQVLQGDAPTEKTRLHLDRCLTCLACETTCPSGVEYGRLLDVGRALVEERAPRTARQRLLRSMLATSLTGRWFAPLLRLAQAWPALVPAGLRSKLPARQPPTPWPRSAHTRRMLLLTGCVQPAIAPNINAATARICDALGITLLAHGAGCCGAIRHHLGDQEGGRAEARRNIDAWWPLLESGCEAIVINASGCGAMVREYGHLLQHDLSYAAKARRVSTLARDVSELVADHWPLLRARLRPASAQRLVFHPPCTLQHAQRIRGRVESVLAESGAQVLPFAEGHMCCGSAGTYSLLQPGLATQLRDRKLTALMAAQPEIILSANIGCIAHLASAAQIPVLHWIEWLDARLAQVPGSMA